MMAKCRMVRRLLMMFLFCGCAAGALRGQTPEQKTVPGAAQAEPQQTKSTEAAAPALPAADEAVQAERPGEYYQQAMKPLEVVRGSLDNWSDAELGALGTGIHMAREACGRISIKMIGDEDLYDMIRLCALGQDWTKTNTAALNYLSRGAEPHRAQAYAMSLNALTRLDDRDDAVKTAREMLNTLPYDAEVAYAMRYFVNFLSFSFDAAALELATKEHAAIVEALEAGVPLKATHGEAVMSLGELFDSGLRLAFLQRYGGDEDGAARTYGELDAALAKVRGISAADHSLIAAAQTQYKLLGAQLPEMDAQRFLAPPMTKTKVRSDPGFVMVLAIFPEWCPQCRKVMQGLTAFAAGHAAAKVHAKGLMVEDAGAGPQPNYSELKGTPTVKVTEETAEVFGAMEYPLIVVTDEKGMIYFAGLIPDNAFVPNGYLEKVIGRIVGGAALIRNGAAAKAKSVLKKAS